MKCSVEYDPELKLVQCIFAGPVSVDDINQSQIKAINLARENNTNMILIDDSEWETELSTIDIYQYPQLYYEMNVDPNTKAAIILPSSHAAKRDARFYETVCRNSGWNIAVFQKRQDAIGWLLDNTPYIKPEESLGYGSNQNN